MPHYAVSYDLRKVRNYDGLIDYLKKCGFVRPLKSFWLGSTPHTAGEVLKDLKRFMDSDDGVVVIEIQKGSDWAVEKPDAFATVVAWLRRNIKP